MTDDPTEIVGESSDEIQPGFNINYAPRPGNKIHLSATYGGDTLESGEYPLSVLTEVSVRAQFLNSVEDSLTARDGVDAEQATRALKEWFAHAASVDAEAERMAMADDVRRIIDGTQYPVEVYAGGDETTFLVTLTFDGRTEQLEFTSGEIAANSPAPLKQAITRRFYEKIELEAEGWEQITDKWLDGDLAVYESDDSAELSIAERLVSRMSRTVRATDDREHLANAPEAAWYDATNEENRDIDKDDGPVVWVQGTFLVDSLEAIGESVGSRGNVVETLRKENIVHGSLQIRAWPNNTDKDRERFYAFEPAELGVSADSLAGGGVGANSDEVDA